MTCQTLGLELCENRTLQYLDVSHNRVTGPAALVRWVSILLRVKCSLTQASDSDSARQVLASALQRCRTLNTLIVANNPIGRQGVAALLRAVRARSDQRDEEGAPRWISAVQPVLLELNHCRVGSSSRPEVKEHKLFNPADPSGQFDLSLAVPYDCVSERLWMCAYTGATQRSLECGTPDCAGPHHF